MEDEQPAGVHAHVGPSDGHRAHRLEGLLPVRHNGECLVVLVQSFTLEMHKLTAACLASGT